MSVVHSVGLLLTGLLIGGAHVYLLSVKNVPHFQSTARFRITSPREERPRPAVLIDEIDVSQGSGKIAVENQRTPIFREGDRVRDYDVVRLAVVNGKLNQSKRLGGGSVDEVANRLATSSDLHVGVVGFSKESAIFELRYEAKNPEVAFRVVDSLINAFAKLHFAGHPEADSPSATSDLDLTQRLLAELDAAESTLDERLADWSQFTSKTKSLEGYRDELSLLRKQHEVGTSERAELGRRLTAGRELMQAKRPLVEVLAAVRGNSASIVESERDAGEESIRGVLKSEISRNKEAISVLDARLSSLNQSINQQSDALRQFLASKTGVEESQRHVDELRRKYDEVSGRLKQVQNQSKDQSVARFEIVQAARPGELIEVGVPPEIIEGLFWGGVAGASFSILIWAASTAVRERRRRAW